MNTPISLLDVLRDNERLQLENARLKEENESLKQELAQYYHAQPSKSASQPPQTPKEPDKSSPMYTLYSDEKGALFRSVFRGREDVFARRWRSASSGKRGYQPVCENEWRADLCDKKQYKCSECPNRRLASLSDRDIFNHLSGNDPNGRDVIGLFPVLTDNTCYLLCADFDDKNSEHGYKEDNASLVSLMNTGITLISSPDISCRCAVIDKKLIWYGSINYLGRNSAEDNAMRFEDASLASDLLDILSPR